MLGILYLTVLCDHPCLVSLLFAILLRLVTFLTFFITCLSCFSSRHVPQLRFAITQQKSVFTDSILGPLIQVLATPVVLVDWPKHPFKHRVNPSLDGWRPALPLWRSVEPIDPGIQKAWSLIHSFRAIHVCDRDLSQSFQVPSLIDNIMHTLLLW